MSKISSQISFDIWQKYSILILTSDIWQSDKSSQFKSDIWDLTFSFIRLPSTLTTTRGMNYSKALGLLRRNRRNAPGDSKQEEQVVEMFLRWDTMHPEHFHLLLLKRREYPLWYSLQDPVRRRMTGSELPRVGWKFQHQRGLPRTVVDSTPPKFLHVSSEKKASR